MEENKVADSAYFITLTYDTNSVPITGKGFMTLVKTSKQDRELQKEEKKDRSLQGFIKRLRYYDSKDQKENSPVLDEIERRSNGIRWSGKKLKFYGVGEYGSIRRRPHYHIILFNLYNKANINEAWPFGSVHVDSVNNNTIDYTLKYMDKVQKGNLFKSFDGQKEFAIMSKNLGAEYLKKNGDWHRKNLENHYLFTERGFKIPIPKYYRDRMYDKRDKNELIAIIKEKVDEKVSKEMREAIRTGLNYDKIEQNKVENRFNKMKKPDLRKDL